MNINENLVKILAKAAPINKELTIDQEVVIGAKGTVTKVEDKTNFDGTINRIYHVTVELAEEMSIR